MRYKIVRKQRHAEEKMRQYNKFKSIIEKDKPQHRRRRDHKLQQEWDDLTSERRTEISGMRRKARKISRLIKSYCDSFSVLLVGHFTSTQNFVYCALNMDLHFLL